MTHSNLNIAIVASLSALFFSFLGCATGQLQNIEVLMRQHDWSNATTALEESIQKNPRDGEAHLLLAEAYGETGQVAKMQEILERARSISPRLDEDADYLARKYWIKNFNLGNSRFEEHFFNQAVPFFQRTTLIDSANVLGWQRYGDVLFKLRQLKSAEVAYRRALALQPRSSTIKNNLAQIYFRRKQYRKSIDLCSEILAADAGDKDALKRRAYSYSALSDFQNAETDFLEASVVAPSAQILADFGLLYVRNGKHRQAIPRLEEALDYTENRTLIFKRLGEANLAVRDYAGMARWYRKVVASAPDDLVGWKSLAIAYEALGLKADLAQARHFINRIVSTN